MSTLPRSDYHHGGLRAALFAAALDLLAADGAEALSLRAVARRAGVSAMAPYRHYADKAALLAAVAVEGFGRLRDAMRDADLTASAGEALKAQAQAYVSFALKNPAMFNLMFDARRFETRPEVTAAGGEAFEILTDRMSADAAGGADPPARVVAIWAMAHGLADLFLEGQIADRMDGPDDAVIRRVIESAFAGFG